MPKVSKVRAANTRPGEAKPPEEKRNKNICTRCGATYVNQRGNFPSSQSPLFVKNGGYLPVCNHCLEGLYEHYLAVLGSEEAAIRRLCLKFDIYWHKDIFAMIYRANTTTSRIKSYISKTNLYKYVGKTYDDTMDEEGMVAAKAAAPALVTDYGEDVVEQIDTPTAEAIAFWGAGLPADMYFSLTTRYNTWTANLESIDKVKEARYKQICILEENINVNIRNGKNSDASIKTLNELIKEVEKDKDDAANEAFDDLPFGVGIRMFENARPIPKPLPELNDVDHIVRYISIWFLGHLCKMLGIKNTYCKLYEEEMARRRVERPELEEEDDEGAFNEIFGGGAE